MPATDRLRDDAGLAESLAAAAREAGALAMRSFGTPVRQWLKGNTSPVSEADIAVDRLLRERLTALDPGAAWLSEETEDGPERLQARRVFVVDPIDGTRAFLAGLPDWSVSTALVVDGRPVAAALYVPVSDEMFVAVAGGGARLNGQAITADPYDSLSGRRVAGPKRLIDWVAGDAGLVTVPKVHSLALRLARVAHGALDAAFAAGDSRDWDLAAADLLVHEAGGAMTTLAGQLLTYNRPEPIHRALVAAGRSRHAALIELMQDRSIDIR